MRIFIPNKGKSVESKVDNKAADKIINEKKINIKEKLPLIANTLQYEQLQLPFMKDFV